MFTNTIPVPTERWAVGLDVHARSVSACALDLSTGELRTARLVPDPGGVLAWLAGLGGSFAVAYEAGPTGFGLARALDAGGIRCVVAAPSKIARAAGDRVKTDKRDAALLARRLAAGDLAAVHVPTPVQEAARDLTRAYEDVRHDLMGARHRVSKLLLRHGILYDGGTTWGRAHHAWLAQVRLPGPAQDAFEDARQAVVLAESRKKALAEKITALGADPTWAPTVTALGCLRGIAAVTATPVSC